VVVVCGFALHCFFTFEQRPAVQSFALYAAGMATNYPASVALMFVFYDLAGLPVWTAAPLATVILVGWNYLMARWAITGSAALERAA
jgi:putative flippase GtrA